jgi:hypothetical protein
MNEKSPSAEASGLFGPIALAAFLERPQAGSQIGA